MASLTVRTSLNCISLADPDVTNRFVSTQNFNPWVYEWIEFVQTRYHKCLEIIFF
jgi:hypothetical protein